MIYHVNINQKRAGMTILILAKVGFRENTANNTESHFIMIKGSTHQENICFQTLRHLIIELQNTRSKN